jgi:hypothetical protein
LCCLKHKNIYYILAQKFELKVLNSKMKIIYRVLLLIVYFGAFARCQGGGGGGGGSGGGGGGGGGGAFS